MSSDAKANTLPKWSYILLAVLLGRSASVLSGPSFRKAMFRMR